VEYKRELRKSMKLRRSELSDCERQERDNIIYEKLISSEAYLKAKVIFIYISYGDEVNTHSIVKHALSIGKRICVPKVISKETGMKSIEIKSLDELNAGAYGILEPHSEGIVVKPDEIDMIILPGLAFDKKGGRLGYGGGFYDRYLTQVKGNTVKAALAYNFQIIEKVPTEEFDVPIDYIITN